MQGLNKKKQRRRSKLKGKDLFLIIGVGNPGERYELSRQNIGFQVVDKISAIHKIDINIKKKKSVIGLGKISNVKVCLLRPLTFANITGEAALYIASYLRVNEDKILVIYDDTELDYGQIRITEENIDTGHIGLASIVDAIKAEKFIRVGVGVGKVPENQERTDYVISNFSTKEQANLEDLVFRVSQAVKSIVSESLEKAIHDFSI